jgi:hypothetical protein
LSLFLPPFSFCEEVDLSLVLLASFFFCFFILYCVRFRFGATIFPFSFFWPPAGLAVVAPTVLFFGECGGFQLVWSWFCGGQIRWGGGCRRCWRGGGLLVLSWGDEMVLWWWGVVTLMYWICYCVVDVVRVWFFFIFWFTYRVQICWDLQNSFWVVDGFQICWDLQVSLYLIEL